MYCAKNQSQVSRCILYIKFIFSAITNIRCSVQLTTACFSKVTQHIQSTRTTIMFYFFLILRLSKNFFTPLQISSGTKCSRHLPRLQKKNHDNFSCIGRYWFVLIVKVKRACLLHFLCRGAEAEWDVQELREALSLPQPPARGVPARQAEAHGPLHGALSREAPV